MPQSGARIASGQVTPTVKSAPHSRLGNSKGVPGTATKRSTAESLRAEAQISDLCASQKPRLCCLQLGIKVQVPFGPEGFRTINELPLDY